MENPPTPTIEQLYPSLSDAEMNTAEENLTTYLGLVLHIYQRQQRDKFEH